MHVVICSVRWLWCFCVGIVCLWFHVSLLAFEPTDICAVLISLLLCEYYNLHCIELCVHAQKQAEEHAEVQTACLLPGRTDLSFHVVI